MAVPRAISGWAAFVLIAATLFGSVGADEPLPDLPANFNKPNTQPPIAEFDISKFGDVLLFPISHQNKTYKFLVDTGCTNTVYDESFRPQLGAKIEQGEVKTAYQANSYDFFAEPKSSLGPLSLRTGNRAICIDLSKVSEIIGDKIDGSIGLPFLKRHRIAIDFDAGRVQFLGESPRDPAHAIPLVFAGPYVYVYLRVPVIGDQKFRIDTGSLHSISLEPHLYDLLEKSHVITTVSKCLVSDASGHEKSELVGILPTISVGEIAIPTVCVNRSNENSIGLGLFSRLKILFDFPDEKMYAQPGKQIANPDRWDLSGMRIHKREGRVQIHSVGAESVASRAGLRRNDVLLRLDGLDVTKQSLFILRRGFQQPGSRFVLSVRRGEQELEFKISLPTQADLAKSRQPGATEPVQSDVKHGPVKTN